MRALVVVMLVAACSADGRALPDWTLGAEGLARPAQVTLPSTLLDELPAANAAFSLSRSVALGETERGRELTLALDCFHGRLALDVNGTALSDIGDIGVGEHRFVIPATLAHAEALALTISGRRVMPDTAYGFGTTPRLAVGAILEPSAIAFANRALANGTIALAVLSALIFGVSFAVDRRRRADGVFAIASLVLAIVSGWAIGVTPPWFAGAGLFGWGLCALLFLHVEFELGPPPRRLMIAQGAIAASFFALPLSYLAARIVLLGSFVLVWPYWKYVFGLLWRMARSGSRRADGVILLLGGVCTVVGFLPWALAIGPGWTVAPLRGLHLEIIGLGMYLVSNTILVARQAVARRRSLEIANAELRRQVAERSRDLADALAKVAHQHQSNLAADRVIDSRYKIVRKLGAGGMGVVYEVVRTSDGARLAVKTLRGRVQPSLLARFAREAQIAADIAHPNILPVIDVGVEAGGLFIVMPLVTGGSLEQQRSRFGDATWARPRIAEIAAGLAELHARNIVHRDLKPGNVLLDHDVARIADFGLAGERDDHQTNLSDGKSSDLALGDTAAQGGLTEIGDVFGTPKYMAPELADGVHDYAASADIFALGLIACEMLTGRAAFAVPPFVAARQGQQVSAGDTSGLDPVLARCLDADARNRPSAREIVDALGAPG